MKQKHIFGIIAFIATFTISALLFSSESPQPETVSRRVSVSRQDNCPLRQNQTQKNIRRFLTADQTNGQEFYADAAQIEGDSEIIDTAPATAKLVRKMQRQSCSGLPADFCAAWKLHLEAWQNQSDLQNKASAAMDESDETLDKYTDGNDAINNTYEDLLEAASDYGVDFPE